MLERFDLLPVHHNGIILLQDIDLQTIPLAYWYARNPNHSSRILRVPIDSPGGRLENWVHLVNVNFYTVVNSHKRAVVISLFFGMRESKKYAEFSVLFPLDPFHEQLKVLRKRNSAPTDAYFRGEVGSNFARPIWISQVREVNFMQN